MKASSKINISVYAAAAAVLVLVLLLGEANVSESAVVCNPAELSPCKPAVSSNSPPSKACCNKIRQQRPCFCQYLKNPNVAKILKSPAARKVVAICRVSIPQC